MRINTKRKKKSGPPINTIYVVQSTFPDKLIDTIDVPLTAEQLFYLKHHKHEKRTQLAKKIGISKLQLNYKLEQLERTGSV